MNKPFVKNAEHFGLYFYGDSATIYRRPLLNIMAGSAETSAVVLGIVDGSEQYQIGGIKNAEYIANQFLPFMKKHDPTRQLTDCVFF